MIFVTGSSGLVGRAVVAQLLKDGHEVRCQVRSLASAAAEWDTTLPDASSSKVSLFELDFHTAVKSDYENAVSGCSGVIHCAGLVHQPNADAQSYDILNVKATGYLQQAARAQGVRSFVFLSSSAVYGGGAFADVDEDSRIHPETEYARSKASSEDSLREHPPAPLTVILRPSLVFGEGDRGNMIALIRQINKGLYFHISGNSTCKSVIYSQDLARALIGAIEKLPDGCHLFNAANDRPVSMLDLADIIARQLGRSAPISVPAPVVRLGAIVLQSVLGQRSPLTVSKLDKLQATTTLSVSRLVEQTGFQPVYELPEAISREIAWARAGSFL